jgi:hypothetical protein
MNVPFSIERSAWMALFGTNRVGVKGIVINGKCLSDVKIRAANGQFIDVGHAVHLVLYDRTGNMTPASSPLDGFEATGGGGMGTPKLPILLPHISSNQQKNDHENETTAKSDRKSQQYGTAESADARYEGQRFANASCFAVLIRLPTCG